MSCLFQELCITHQQSNVKAERTAFIGKAGIAGQHAQIIKECFKSFPNATSNVYAEITDNGCYFSPFAFNQIFKKMVLPRCGLCMKLSGPSLKKGYCTIIGGFNSTDTNIYNYATTLFVSDSLFFDLAGYNNASYPSTIPVTAKVVDCPYKTYPSVAVTSIDEERHQADLTVANANTLITKISINEEPYYLDCSRHDCIFHVNFSEEMRHSDQMLKIYNPVGSVLAIDFNFTLNQIFTGHALFNDMWKKNECYLRPDPNVMGTFPIPDSVFFWVLRQHNPEDVLRDDPDFTQGTWLTQVDMSNQIITTPLEFELKEHLILTATFPYPIKISQHYKAIRAVYYSNTTDGDADIAVYSFLGDTFGNLANPVIRTTCVKNLRYSVNETAIRPDQYKIEMEVNLRIAKCLSQVNLFRFHVNVTNPMMVRFETIEFIPLNEINFTVCDTNNYDCTLEDECDPTNSQLDSPDGVVKNYTKGCKPFCGMCRSGYLCNKAARCVKRPNYNTRSSARSVLSYRYLIPMLASVLLLI